VTSQSLTAWHHLSRPCITLVRPLGSAGAALDAGSEQDVGPAALALERRSQLGNIWPIPGPVLAAAVLGIAAILIARLRIRRSSASSAGDGGEPGVAASAPDGAVSSRPAAR
jgi:hypothetical protein